RPTAWEATVFPGLILACSPPDGRLQERVPGEKELTDSSFETLFNSLPAGLFVPVLLLLASCSSPASDLLHGYVEGEFVYVASPLPGTVTLHVSRGATVKKGDPLFALENDAERSARDEAG